MADKPDNNYRERVFRIVRSIPRGRVMTYGQIAEILGEGYTPRTVGFVMHARERQNSLAPSDQCAGWLFDARTGASAR